MREAVFQILYSLDNSETNVSDAVALISKELAITKKYALQALEKVIQIRGKLDILDKNITAVSFSYSFDRITSVEKSILRLGAYELLFEPETPYQVVISEGMRLTKKFSTAQSASFVNAILDAIHKKNAGLTVDPGLIEKSIEELEASEAIAEEASKVLKFEDKNVEE